MSVATLLPPNATKLERALESATARASDVPVPLRALWDPTRCPIELLPYLAWALSIDTWSADWPEAVKRARVRRAMAIQRRKGTVRSIRDVIASFGGAVAIREWWQLDPPGEPHTFSLVVNLTGADTGGISDAGYADAVIEEIQRTKPVRSHFTFTQALDAKGGLVAVGAARPAALTRLALTAPAA